jgi:hypothetical protein
MTIQNIIHDELLKIIDPPVDNLTGANYVTLDPQGQVLAPSNQVVNPPIDLNQIAVDFQSMVQSELDAQLLEFDPVVLMARSPQPGSQVNNNFSFQSFVDSLTTPPITHDVNDFVEVDLIEANQPSSWSSLIDRAWAGAAEGRFVDADNYDNLIEIRPEDAEQLGGIRAWQGDDKVMGTPESDIANGNEGNDRIFGYDGIDLLLGGAGDDYLAGGAGDDVLVGEVGSDVLIGNAGADLLIADGLSADGKGDFLIGSAGADEFVFRSKTLANDPAYAHRILDFNPTEGDIIKIADFTDIPGINQISFARVDVNQDDTPDTAIFCADGVVGVVMSKDPSQIDLTSSIFMVKPQDAYLTKISEFSMLSSH